MRGQSMPPYIFDGSWLVLNLGLSYAGPANVPLVAPWIDIITSTYQGLYFGSYLSFLQCS